MKRLFVILLGCFWLASCGTLSEEGSQMVQVPIALNIKQSVLDTLDKISLTVTGPGMTTLTKDLTPPFTSPVTFSVSVPTGSDRIFTVKARVTEEPLIGYQASKTTNVAEQGGSVPINLQYVNFVLDGTSDTIQSGQMDLSEFDFSVNTQSTSSTTDDLVIFEMTFAGQVPQFTSVFLIEFDKDAKNTTGKTQTKIHELRGALTSGFLAGSELYLVIQDAFGQHFQITLLDSNDQIITFPTSSTVTAVLDQTRTILTLSIDRTTFNSLIDDDGVGLINILVGTKLSSIPMDLPDFSDFSPHDILISSTTVPTMLYETSFDLSGL